MSDTATLPTPTKKPPRQIREFRLMYRPTSTTAGAEKTPKTKEPKTRKKWSLMKRNVAVQFVDELSTFLAGKLGHWALAVLEPTDPPVSDPPVYTFEQPKPRPTRSALAYDDSRIQRVYELRRKVLPESVPRPSTPSDSNDEDRHDSDDGFPPTNEKGMALKMQISTALRDGFSELKYQHCGGLCWEILTGIEARTKFSDSELRHEAQRIWKRQTNYNLLDNNCQRFCILLAIAIRAKNHSLLRVLHGKTVARQMKEIKDAKCVFKADA